MLPPVAWTQQPSGVRWTLRADGTDQVPELLQQLQDVHQLLLHQRQTNPLRLQHPQLHLEQLSLLRLLLELLHQRVLHLEDRRHTDHMDMMSETGPCNPPSDCNAGQVTDEGKERVSVLQTDVVSIAQRSGPPEDITGPIDDSAYYVTWTVLIVLAVPRGEDIDACEAPGKTEKTNKAQSWYHIEYKLLPGDTETVKVDLLVFGPLAKLYKEDEFKVVGTRQDGGQTWVGWSQDFRIGVNKDLLISLLPHTITLQIWNSTAKLSDQARYERTKAFRPTQDQPKDATDPCEFQKPTIDSFNLEETKGISAEIRPIGLLAGE
uniref:Cilia and flagella associated protein 92 (putative) n=1 Tax=Gasterosteus aculeatus aculeatus TaxID=481459 RepID=A0AAQ4PQD6_GASAC